jgi:hypothetical protein
MRAGVMTEVHAAAAVQAAHATAAAVPLPAIRRRHGLSLPRLDGPRWRVPRMAGALGFAVALGLATSAAVAAAPPGSAFYNARVALEAVLLPTQIDERLAAHEQHLDARLAEAEAAAGRGDLAGLDAALAAYRTEVDVAIAEVGEDYDRLSKLQAVLEKHVATLSALAEALAERLPTTGARDNAVDHALQASQKAVTKVQDRKEHADNGPVVPPSQADPPSRPPAPAGEDAGPESHPAEPGR